jgi:hypothetical protein
MTTSHHASGVRKMACRFPTKTASSCICAFTGGRPTNVSCAAHLLSYRKTCVATTKCTSRRNKIRHQANWCSNASFVASRLPLGKAAPCT